MGWGVLACRIEVWVGGMFGVEGGRVNIAPPCCSRCHNGDLEIPEAHFWIATRTENEPLFREKFEYRLLL